MALGTYIDKLISDIQFATWQEWVSTISQVWSILLARKNNIWVFPVGLIGLGLAVYLYFFVADPSLYADSLLNVYYILMSIYGWYIWSLKKEEVEIFSISKSSRHELIIGSGLFIGTWIFLFLFLSKLTNSDTPILDSLVSSSAVSGMWWMTRRKIENWLAYIVSNVIAIPLNFYKGFMLFTLMYVLFLFLAIIGYKEWNKNIKAQKHS